MTDFNGPSKRYLLVSDFDQTLSFHDSGHVLADMVGISDFGHRVAGLSEIHLVQQGGELAYLLLHDPEYRKVRREHLIEVGKRIRLKANIPRLVELLSNLDGHEFSVLRGFRRAGGDRAVRARRHGRARSHHRHALPLRCGQRRDRLHRAPARRATARWPWWRNCARSAGIGQDRIVYVGDGSSDLHVMLHVNHIGGLTIAVSENRYIREVARRSILSDDALSVLVPVLEDVLGWNSTRIRTFFAATALRCASGRRCAPIRSRSWPRSPEIAVQPAAVLS